MLPPPPAPRPPPLNSRTLPVFPKFDSICQVVRVNYSSFIFPVALPLIFTCVKSIVNKQENQKIIILKTRLVNTVAQKSFSKSREYSAWYKVGIYCGPSNILEKILLQFYMLLIYISKTMFHGSDLSSYILVTSTNNLTDFLEANTQGKQSSPN